MAVTMHQLLKTLVDQGGTDLHVTTNSAPQIRVHGKMIPLQTQSDHPLFDRLASQFHRRSARETLCLMRFPARRMLP